MAKFDFNSYPEAHQDGQGSGPGLEDIIRPIVQGGSYGTSDEIIGALRAGGQALTGQTPLDIESLKKAYKENRDEERSANKKSAEANPTTYKTLELLSGLLAPGGALIKGGKGLSLAAKALKTAAGGAALGGLAGAGYSEGETPEEVAKDAAIGAGVGAAPGALLGGAAGIAKAAKYLPVPLFSKIGAGVTEGLKGNLPGNVKLTENVENLLSKVADRKGIIKKAYDEIIGSAEAEGRKVNVEDFQKFVQKLKEEAATNRTPEVVNDINKVVKNVEAYTTRLKEVPIEKAPSNQGMLSEYTNFGKNVETPAAPEMATRKVINPEISPKEAQNLKSSLGQYEAFSPINPDLETKEGRQFAGELKDKLGNQLQSDLPGLKSTDQQYGSLINTLKQIGIKPESLMTKNQLTGEMEVNPKAIKTIQSLLKQASAETGAAPIAKKSVDLFGQGLQSANVPSDMTNLLNKARASSTFDTVSGKFGGYIGKGAEKTLTAEPTAKALATAPETVDTYNREPRNSFQLSEDLKNASKQDLQDMVNTAHQIPGLENQAQKLQKSIEDENYRTTNQIMHDLLQRPNFRKSLEEK